MAIGPPCHDDRIFAVAIDEDEHEFYSLKEVLDFVRAQANKGIHIQRYKGLGEMNPEQLWETSMDKNSRKLLKVSIEDALEADRWFATLMGDDVGGRRAYIEEFGQFVKNLDV